MKSNVLIIHGERASGKTTRVSELVEKAKEEGITVRGVLSKRIMNLGETIGYDGVDLCSGLSFPLARLKGKTRSPDWQTVCNLIYVFSGKGVRRANRILMSAAEEMCESTLIVVDEYGHLEKQGNGLCPGLNNVINSLSKGGSLAVVCRTDKVDDLLDLLSGRNNTVLLMEASRPDFWASLGDSFI